MSSYKQVLRHRVAGTLFVSSTTSTLGDWVGFAALLVMAFERSGGNAVGPAALFSAQGIAAVASSVLAGPWLDRVDRRQGIMAGYLLGGLAMTLPLVITRGLWPLVLTAALVGALRPLTAALRHATAGADLPPSLLGPTIALEGSTGQFVVALGLAVGATIAVFPGPTGALLLDVATFVFAGLHARRLPQGRGGAGRGGWMAGYRAAFADVTTRRLLLLLVASALVGSLPETLASVGAQVTTIAPDGREVVSNSWLPIVIAAQALGTAFGSFAVGIGRRFEQPSGLAALTMWSALLLFGGALVFDSHPAILALANLLFGVAFAFTITARTAFTRSIESGSLGSAVAAAITMVMLAEAIGSMALAALADATSAAAAYSAAGGALAMTAIVAVVMPVRRAATTAPHRA